MGHRHDRHAALVVQSIEKIEDLHLVAVVEEACGLIQQEDRTALSEGGGNRGALAFATRQRRHRAVRELGYLSQIHGTVDRFRIGLGERRPRTDMGEPPHLDERPHAVVERPRVRLRHIAHRPRQLAASDLGERSVVYENATV